MPNYRRAYLPGGTFFFTLVTYRRQRFLCEPAARVALRRAVADCRRDHPFDLLASVLLPDHLHMIWRLPEGDADFSTRWSLIKSAFTRAWLKADGAEGSISDSRRRNRRRGVWQRRFWERCLRDQDDLNRHVDYVHYNPVKHGIATCPHAWPWTSFHRWVRDGFYDADWCCSCDGRTTHPLEFDWADGLEME